MTGKIKIRHKSNTHDLDSRQNDDQWCLTRRRPGNHHPHPARHIPDTPLPTAMPRARLQATPGVRSVRCRKDDDQRPGICARSGYDTGESSRGIASADNFTVPLTAIGWEVIDRERWHEIGEMVNNYQSQPSMETRQKNRNGGTDTSVGTLIFRDGKLVQWGETKKGSALRPVERHRGVKGGSAPPRSEGAILSYLGLRGAVSPFTALPYEKPISSEPAIHDCYSPLPREEPNAKDRHGRYGVKEAREVLRSFKVDGSVPFDRLPFAATRHPDGIVTGEQWIGGVKKPKPNASEPAGKEPEFVRQVETLSYVDYLRRRLGQHAKVLDLAITDTSAKDIGIAMGLAPAYAEKRGPSLIEAAIDALIELDETARGEFTPIEDKIAA
ncbi:hypothetical protein WGT02_38640 (plasmid) [Rhizobium sp. T1470]|uniref:hypothetical protein n=1 Tax=unclassified Rhizobium TaxID=2613769 RepID=UPI001CD3EB7E|nr:hypothetical protein [Rhizobium sp. T1473]